MKKIIIAIVALFAMSTAANAQLSDLGVRFNGGYGYGAELSALWGMGGNRLETDLGWNLGDHWNAISFAAVYQWTGEIGSGFGWFAGVGGWLGMWSHDANYVGVDNDGFNLALAGQAGIEYNFDAIPIQLSLDVRPRFNLIPSTHFDWGGVAFGIRYRF